jgi:hypothetical protein
LNSFAWDAEIDHVTDFAQIAGFRRDVHAPSFVERKVVSYGKVLKTDEVVKILQKSQ